MASKGKYSIYYKIIILNLIKFGVSRRSQWSGEGAECLRLIKHWDRGLESHSRHGYMAAHFLRLCCPV
jgi:hypothetical protein